MMAWLGYDEADAQFAVDVGSGSALAPLAPYPEVPHHPDPKWWTCHFQFVLVCEQMYLKNHTTSLEDNIIFIDARL